MMYRHIIAPSRGFTPFSHEIIRHPRLGSDAVRLLTWQLSLPPGAAESLSRTAERARIGACAFARAKRQLKEEGFVHERRVQGPGGRWVTEQLVSNRPLSAAEAAKLLGRVPVPGAGIPAVGGPTTPSTGGHPKKDRVEDTSDRPPGPDVEVGAAPPAPPAPPPPAAPEEARALVAALPLLSPALRYIPAGMRDELAGLAARWLAAGHSAADIHAHLLRGLPGGGTPVHRPGGLVRYLLREVPPPAPPEAVTPGPRTGPRLSARLDGVRECEGEHLQATLFRPVGDETLCARCAPRPAPPPPAPLPAGPPPLRTGSA
ncbi:hypothetical protein ABZ135_06170 [Streptomyces sp. NPDC006339]|uniref:hypothetical protein n=1 Tax=Streptomyces sp. NPDC006339 TaxID=3156755 RepID=UPI0033AFFAC6